ncbi:MAG TPA: M56 family metallopeptidase [Caulobacteraceae bacterium]|jgi:beta-lactamase regulating signal transducer with metallopeptidase domain
MTSADLLLALARLNLAASAAVLLVLALRGAARRWIGPHLAYRLWLLVPVAAAGALLPGPGDGPAGALDAVASGRVTGTSTDLLFWLWTAGFVAAVSLGAWRHWRFALAERAGRAGPAVLGVIQPRLVVPRDFARRYSPDERRLIRAHELAHIERGDARCNALAALAVSACWFNPLALVAMRAMRFDQELACDATVLTGAGVQRRAYAETLLNAAPAALQAPFVSHLHGEARSLETRLRTLMQPRTPDWRGDAGLAGLVALGAVVFAAAWWVQPPSIPPAMQTLVVVSLDPPSAATRAWVYADLPKRPR